MRQFDLNSQNVRWVVDVKSSGHQKKTKKNAKTFLNIKKHSAKTFLHLYPEFVLWHSSWCWLTPENLFKMKIKCFVVIVAAAAAAAASTTMLSYLNKILACLKCH